MGLVHSCQGEVMGSMKICEQELVMFVDYIFFSLSKGTLNKCATI